MAGVQYGSEADVIYLDVRTLCCNQCVSITQINPDFRISRNHAISLLVSNLHCRTDINKAQQSILNPEISESDVAHLTSGY